MRIALLLVGRLDTFEEMYPSLKEYILTPLSPDIFFSGYPNRNGLEYCDEKINILWSPKKYIIIEYTDKIRREIHPNDLIFDDNKRSETTPHTWLSGIYNVKKCNELKKQYENENNFQYDVVIKSRTDVKWYDFITESELNLAKEGNILIPTAWDFKCIHPLGTSDVVAISDSNGIDKYSSLIDYVDEYWKQGNIFHPESYVGIHIQEMKLNRIEINSGIDQTGWCLMDSSPNRKSF
jgi:hypothetical protein